MRNLAMKTALVGLAGLVLTTAGTMAAEPRAPAEPRTDAATACPDMMRESGATEEGSKAMREFMQSDRAPRAMANMMEMARQMGGGDLMLGMTRMMEMMGSMGGGMMGGQGMMAPGARQPAR